MSHNRPESNRADQAAGEETRIRTLTERAARTERDLAATFHELRTPVTNIMGFAETLLEGVAAGDPAKTRRFLGIIAAQAARMAKLLDDLQTLMELESGRRVPVPEPLPLAAAVTRSLEQTAELRSSRNLELLSHGVRDVTVTADPDLLNRLLVNLLTNAVTATPDGGQIAIAATFSGSVAVLTVADTGIGMPEPALSRVFDRFYRVDVARSRKQGGSGLGLTLVREIVRLHGGDVMIESHPGRGTVVTVRFPALC